MSMGDNGLGNEWLTDVLAAGETFADSDNVIGMDASSTAGADMYYNSPFGADQAMNTDMVQADYGTGQNTSFHNKPVDDNSSRGRTMSLPQVQIHVNGQHPFGNNPGYYPTSSASTPGGTSSHHGFYGNHLMAPSVRRASYSEGGHLQPSWNAMAAADPQYQIPMRQPSPGLDLMMTQAHHVMTQQHNQMQQALMPSASLDLMLSSQQLHHAQHTLPGSQSLDSLLEQQRIISLKLQQIQIQQRMVQEQQRLMARAAAQHQGGSMHTSMEGIVGTGLPPMTMGTTPGVHQHDPAIATALAMLSDATTAKIREIVGSDDQLVNYFSNAGQEPLAGDVNAAGQSFGDVQGVDFSKTGLLFAGINQPAPGPPAAAPTNTVVGGIDFSKHKSPFTGANVNFGGQTKSGFQFGSNTTSPGSNTSATSIASIPSSHTQTPVSSPFQYQQGGGAGAGMPPGGLSPPGLAKAEHRRSSPVPQPIHRHGPNLKRNSQSVTVRGSGGLAGMAGVGPLDNASSKDTPPSRRRRASGSELEDFSLSEDVSFGEYNQGERKSVLGQGGVSHTSRVGDQFLDTRPDDKHSRRKSLADAEMIDESIRRDKPRIEKMRRERLNELIFDLHRLLPNNQTIPMQKPAVISSSIEFIMELKRRDVKMQGEVSALSEEVRRLRDTVELLQRLHNKHLMTTSPMRESYPDSPGSTMTES